MIPAFLHATCFFVLAVALHIAIAWLAGNLKFMGKGVLLGVFILIILNINHQGVAYNLFSSVIFTLLWLFYVFLMGCFVNSVSLYLLAQMDSSGSTSLTKKEIVALFNEKDSLDKRLYDMATNGFVCLQKDGVVGITRKGRIFAWFLSVIRGIFFIEHIG